jgi:hypothetical protein
MALRGGGLMSGLAPASAQAAAPAAATAAIWSSDYWANLGDVKLFSVVSEASRRRWRQKRITFEIVVLSLLALGGHPSLHCTCLLLAQSGHRLVHCTCQLMTRTFLIAAAMARPSRHCRGLPVHSAQKCMQAANL